MRPKRRAFRRAMACALVVFGAGSFLPLWQTWDIGPRINRRGENEMGIVFERTNFWPAAYQCIAWGDWGHWTPGRLEDYNFWPTLGLLSLSGATGAVLYWRGVRHLAPDGAEDYGDGHRPSAPP